jgi:hypothetical protein
MTAPKGRLQPIFLREGKLFMKPEEEVAVKVTKEIVIKYIEIGRLALANFDEAFRTIYKTVLETLRNNKV